MFIPRKLIPILACIGLAGCVTYPNDGYFYSPNINSYGGEDYYGDSNYDDGYYGNYGQYEYYGAQPSITFNFNFNYGYPGYSGYYPYYGYYDYRPCSSWSSFCYAYRPNYGWGYWPVYVYRPHHHHHDNHHSHNGNNNHGNGNHHDNDNNQENQPNRPDDLAQDRPNRANPRPNEPIRAPRQNRTPSLPHGNSPNVVERPVQPNTQQRQEYAYIQPRYRIPQNLLQAHPEQTEREEQLTDPDKRKYIRMPRYSNQQPGLEPKVPDARSRGNRNNLNQHYGQPDDTAQQSRPAPQDLQRQVSNGSRNNYATLPQPVQVNRRNPTNNQNQVVQQPQPQPQAKPVRVEKPERRESKKSNNDDE